MGFAICSIPTLDEWPNVKVRSCFILSGVSWSNPTLMTRPGFNALRRENLMRSRRLYSRGSSYCKSCSSSSVVYKYSEQQCLYIRRSYYCCGILLRESSYYISHPRGCRIGASANVSRTIQWSASDCYACATSLWVLMLYLTHTQSIFLYRVENGSDIAFRQWPDAIKWEEVQEPGSGPIRHSVSLIRRFSKISACRVPGALARAHPRTLTFVFCACYSLFSPSKHR